MRVALLLFAVLFLAASCSDPDARQPVFGTMEELMEKELGDAKVLDAKNWNGHTIYLYVRNQGTTHEEVAVGTIRKDGRGYAWISSPSFRIDVAARFDFTLPDENEAVDVYIGKAARDGISRVFMRGVSEPLDVYDGYFWGFQLPEHAVPEFR